MTTTACPKCKGTGCPRTVFYKSIPLCDCEAGQRLAAVNAAAVADVDGSAAKAAWEATCAKLKTERDTRRAARRAARP